MINGYQSLLNTISDSYEMPFTGFDIENLNIFPSSLGTLKNDVYAATIEEKILAELNPNGKSRNFSIEINFNRADLSAATVNLYPFMYFEDYQ